MLAVCWLGAAAAAPEPAVRIDNFSFTPAEITVPAGTTVTWTNRDDIPHTVTSADDPRAFKSAPLDTGDSFAYRFDHAGRFAYFCSLHAHMQGVVVVK
jgi:plastocyanin